MGTAMDPSREGRSDRGRPPCSKGWADRCAASTSTRCRCACHGHGHGVTRGPSLAVQRDEALQAKERRQLEKFHAKRKGQVSMFDPPKAPEYGPMDMPVREFKPDAPADSWRLVCSRVDRDARFVLVDDTGETAPFAQRLVRHSPTGMEWGYGGSGPADLALNILALFVSPEEASRLHQVFKWMFVANWDRDHVEFPLSAAKLWLALTWEEERRNREPIIMTDDMSGLDARIVDLVADTLEGPTVVGRKRLEGTNDAV